MSNKKLNMSYLDQVGLVVLCVQTSRDNVSGLPVYVTPTVSRCQLTLEMHSLNFGLYSTESRCLFETAAAP